ncbi:MAG TPA: tetratricopeptide repeat protein [Pirellulales bacterium]|jgi:tetratricopeptide (TPR) repeat protein|nr:tetratricopeptide repeat protein [Pirellulales bacterium]
MANSDAILAQANLYAARGDHARALAEYQRVLEIMPDSADAHNSAGNALLELDRAQEAVAAFENARRIQPESAVIEYNLANAFRRLEQAQQAEQHYHRAIELDPRLAPAHNNLGTLLQARDEVDSAETAYRRAIMLEPGYAEAHYNLGVLLARRGDLDGAIASYQLATQLDLRNAHAYYNLGAALKQLRRSAEAQTCYEATLQLDPGYAEAHSNSGTIDLELGRFDAAREHFQQAIRLSPNLAEAHHNLGILHLLHGNFEAGWREYAWQAHSASPAGRKLDQPRWDGSPLDGRTLLVIGEYGLGDNLQYVRYVPELRKRGAGRVLAAVNTRLHPLLKSSHIGDLVDLDELDVPFDVHVPLVSLPCLFRETDATFPREIPYLHAYPKLVRKWRDKLADISPLRVGVNWQGNPEYPWDHWRSIALLAFEPLARVPGVRLISLQKGLGTDQIAAAQKQFELVVLPDDLDTQGAFVDTAAIIANLDLVITSDTAMAHLAGGLGARVWLATSRIPEWRWFLDREDSPWYPSMRLFRQTELGRWDDVFRRMADELAALVR